MWIEAYKGDVLPALLRPLTQAAMDVLRAADLQHHSAWGGRLFDAGVAVKSG